MKQADETSPFTLALNDTNYSFELVDIDHPLASKLKISTNNGVKALKQTIPTPDLEDFKLITKSSLN